MTHLEKYGKRMVDNGYQIIPIARGYKFPKGFKDWEKTKATHADVDAWIKAGYPGIGVLCEHVPAVDLDIPNQELAVEMWKEVTRIAGAGPLRVGQPPKVLMPFKTLAPFGKMSSKKYINPAENDPTITYQVEILGAGNQFVAEAIHPDTKKPYVWKEKIGNLAEIARGDLPTLDQYKAREIIEVFEAKIPVGWEEVSKSGTKSAATGRGSPSTGAGGSGAPLPSADTFANMKSKWGGSVDQLRTILSAIDPTDYKMWVDAGFCIWHETDGSEVGFGLWDEWSKGAPEEYIKDTDKERRKKWQSYDWHEKAERGEVFKTFKSLVFYAHGGALDDSKEVTGFLNRYFYIKAGKKVFDTTYQDNMNHAFLDLDEFHESMKNVQVVLPVPAGTEKDPLRMKDKVFFVSQKWQQHENRKTCPYLIYEPGKPVIHNIGENMYQINTCNLPTFPMTDPGEGKLEVFLEHMELLFPDEGDRHWFVGWMARKIQDPGDKCDVTPLLVAPEEGVGRSWLGYVLFELLGPANCKRVEIKALSAGNSFNSYMNNSLICVIDEVFQRGGGQGLSDGKFAISSSLRSKITEKTAEINVKFEPTVIKQVYTDFLLMTNERDALSFTDTNRRIAVFIYEGMPRNKAYYDRLYGWINDYNKVGVSALWWYLKKYDINGIDFKRAPETEAKKRMIEHSKSALELAIDDLIEDPPFLVMTAQMMIDYLRDNVDLYDGLDPFKMSDKQLLQILKHNRKVKQWKSETDDSRIRVGKKQYRVWVLDKRIDISLEKAKAEIEKQIGK